MTDHYRRRDDDLLPAMVERLARLEERTAQLQASMAMLVEGMRRMEDRLETGYVTNQQLATTLNGYVTEKSLLRVVGAVIAGSVVATVAAVIAWFRAPPAP